ncbi:nicotinate-nucleotide--dimethylbenzimidazole phosphoribosyltransferase [Corallincola holothuriorum]|uniref:Nicotinate-nucleotide--dimethylbenzimidazole phosphoribosyltransferase n=1 Tax=Corallincola holothuriorum TaxID=2282215 RepID=A0A368NGS1_9GAMM|nr:nicotinate-nucleotide--dimethylbenzimidazole phosphoribosyltransferase [Corallincola holothuriorum]RCU49386.1 nicotinate-nucleotide--dimethylbenzimidazole phosphoribosyltransferase [Corallincola holothuriorum]
MWSISHISDDRTQLIRTTIDNKTKPLGALGALETLALQIAQIQDSATPALTKPVFWVFAGDHGITDEGVSAYPKEVTSQMVMNFVNGGAAINVFCRQHDIQLYVVDAGISSTIEYSDKLLNCSLGKGTKNFLLQNAMTSEQVQFAFSHAKELIAGAERTGTNIVGFGEMGIGNTTSAAALMALVTGIQADLCVGRGTGVDDAGVSLKAAVVSKLLARVNGRLDPVSALAAAGGFEIAMMTGAMLAAAESKMVVLVDGFIASVAALLAYKIAPAARDYFVFCHASDERGHQRLLAEMNARPLLDLGMRLGEGTGAALAYPLCQSAVAFLNEMASFGDAGVSQ